MVQRLRREVTGGGDGALPGAHAGAGLLLLLLSATAPSVLRLDAEAGVLPRRASLCDGVWRGELESEGASCLSISGLLIPEFCARGFEDPKA